MRANALLTIALMAAIGLLGTRHLNHVGKARNCYDAATTGVDQPIRPCRPAPEPRQA